MESLVNHIALTSSTQIDEICRPLKELDISYFSFVRSFDDGSHIRLSNNPMWTKHYYDRGFYNVVLKQVPDENGNLLWSNIDKFPLFYEAAEFFDVDNGTVIVLSFGDITERYFFGASKKNTHVNHIYIHKIDLLKMFILYFKQAAADIIKNAEKTKIFVPSHKMVDTESEFYDDARIQKFLAEVRINNVSIRTNGEDFHVTKQDAKILSLLKHGYTAKSISGEVGLSTKTVEIYRDKLKEKLGQFTKDNLISLARSNPLLELKLFV